MYLSGDAKIWWPIRIKDDSKFGRLRTSHGRPLKKEWKDQFLPTNLAKMEKESLKKLK